MNGTELLKQFKDFGITHDAKDNRFQHTLDFQDFIGHQNRQELKSFYKDLDQTDRGIFIWACIHTLAFDSSLDIIKYTTVLLERERLYDDFDKDIMERETLLFHNTNKLQAAKKYVYKRLAKVNRKVETLENRIAWLTTHNSSLENANRQLHACLRNAKSKSANFDKIQSAMELLMNETA